jgi:hypothetical protein
MGWAGMKEKGVCVCCVGKEAGNEIRGEDGFRQGAGRHIYTILEWALFLGTTYVFFFHYTTVDEMLRKFEDQRLSGEHSGY